MKQQIYKKENNTWVYLEDELEYLDTKDVTEKIEEDTTTEYVSYTTEY